MSFSCSMKHKFCVILVAFRMSGGTAMPLGITAGNLGSRNQPVRNDVYIPQIQQTKLSQNSNYSETQLMALNIKTTHYFLFLFWIYSFSLISTHYCCLLTVPVNKLVNVSQKCHALWLLTPSERKAISLTVFTFSEQLRWWLQDRYIVNHCILSLKNHFVQFHSF